uniref:Nuclear factor related to kappa-B-binding protein n=1 Tax=Parasteatoda tepidariorum TaxID=114398 RepID=A0A2L2YQN5_PARTP
MFGLCQQWLDGKDDISLDMLETSQGSPPPPRVTTGWTVRPTAENEKQAYRQQECVRYQNPHKAFTFKVHGYEAVVGPVKGVYGKESGVNKAREHSLLTSDRPPFVTILSLVRDSAARLPNGEGTRADICELLKDSQYLAAASDQQIHTVVSGALDRLHYEKDPCVKYDVNRKLWIYLHRHRTEEEFERIHQAQAAAAKARKAVQKNKLPKIKHSRPLPVSLGPETTALNIDIPTLISSGSQSPKTQGSPKPNRYVMHTSSQVDIKMAVESNVKKEEDSSISNPPETELIAAPVTLSSCVQDISNSRPSTSTYSFATAKNAIGNITATQIVSVTPIQIKSTDQIKPNISTQVHDVLNVDMKPSSPSFVGQPPVLQPVISHQISDKTNPVIPTSTTPTLITTPIITKAKANCLQANALAGFQTIVIKQEPGLRPCGTIPLLSIEENMPSSNSSGPVVARLVHGSQYLSFSNILASSNACSSNKPLAGTVQNFRVHGGNICQQVLSTSTIKVMHSAPVSAIADTRFPVIQLKNQVNAKEAAPTSLNVCGRIYQMTNIRNAVISKPNDTKIPANKDNSEIEDLKESISATVPSAPLSVPNRKTQPVIKVSPK